ncbi:BF3164 family lipoprotein [Bacteroides sp. UBA939]|uniref:BF3164 family lipoprotein n=1 Tax=Bacteroides sp. UBA939 TaxID=1946092 RepID=UPI0025BD4B3C|nr:BF3164 family lipoprotein [Bacteroides sp. UBA939]
MKNNLVLIILLSIIFVACEQPSVSIDTFDEVCEIVAYDSIYSDEDVLDIITHIGIHNDILIAKYMRDEYNFSFIDATNGKLLKRWGKVGEGPGEFIDFGGDFFIQDSCFVFVERNKQMINSVSLTDILGDSSTINVVKEPYPYTVDFRPFRFRFLDNQTIATGSFKEGRFGILDSNNNIVGCYFDYPFAYDEINGIYRGATFQGEIMTNNKQGKFVISTFASDIFEIYQVSDSGVYKKFVTPYKNAPLICQRRGRYAIDYDKSIAGLMKMAVSDDLICFTYSSLNYTEAAAMDKVSREILCFNWEGEKVKKYILPFPIGNFCIDEHYIYGIRYFDDKTVIYRFDLYS